jgi:hypothetical protein
MTENNNNENNGPTLKRMVGHTKNWLAFFLFFSQTGRLLLLRYPTWDG